MAKFMRNAGVTTVVAVLAVVLVAALAGAGRVAAADRQAAPGHEGGRGLCREAGREAAAQALGLTAEELSTQLWGGRSLAELAESAGVDLQTVRDAVEAACQQAMRDRIEQAVADGSLTRAHADWLLEGLEAGYLGAGGKGFGFGPGGGPHGGPRGFEGGRGRGPGRAPFGSFGPGLGAPGTDG